MTNEKARFIISNIDKAYRAFSEEEIQALETAITALKQQPCEQIKWERDVAISQLKELGYGLGEKIRSDEDCISRAETKRIVDFYKEQIDGIFRVNESIDNLPSVQPKTKVGHWINGICSECKYDWSKDAPIASVPTFCPSCGAKME